MPQISVTSCGYLPKMKHFVANLLISFTFKLPLRAVLSTSRRKKSFLLFFAHEKGLGHMFQK